MSKTETKKIGLGTLLCLLENVTYDFSMSPEKRKDLKKAIYNELDKVKSLNIDSDLFNELYRRYQIRKF